MKYLFQSWGWGWGWYWGLVRKVWRKIWQINRQQVFDLRRERNGQRRVFELRCECVEGLSKESCRLVSRRGADMTSRLWKSWETWGQGHPSGVLLGPQGVGIAANPLSLTTPENFSPGQLQAPFSKPGGLQLPLISWATWPFLGNAPSTGFSEVREGPISKTLEV